MHAILFFISLQRTVGSIRRASGAHDGLFACPTLSSLSIARPGVRVVSKRHGCDSGTVVCNLQSVVMVDEQTKG